MILEPGIPSAECNKARARLEDEYADAANELAIEEEQIGTETKSDFQAIMLNCLL